MKKRIFALLLALLCTLVSTAIPASAYELDESEVSAGAYYLYNIENAATLAEKNADVSLSPSSTAKIMTACLALESGIDGSTVITVTSKMLSTSSGRAMGLRSGDRLTVDDLLFATVCGGYNDAALALALTVSDSVEGFVSLMNEKAASLGMDSTTYANPTGIEISGMSSSARDIATLAEYMAKNERFVEIGKTKSYTLSSSATCSRTTISNRSSLLASYRGMSSFNVGSGSGDYAVVYYKSGELSYICVVMGAVSNSEDSDSANHAETLTKRLLAHATNDYSLHTVMSADNIVDTVPVKYSIDHDEIDLYLAEDIKIYLSNEIDTEADLTYSTYLYEDLKAPLDMGDIVGELVVSYEGKILATGYLTVRESIDRNAFLHIMDMMRSYLSSRPFFITLFSFVGIMIAYYLIKRRHLEKMYNSKRKRRRNK